MSATKSVPNGKGGMKTVWVDDAGNEYDSADILNLPVPPKPKKAPAKKKKKAKSKK
jgi:hypothetical protein